MIIPVREKAGLGHPPQHFTTNANESMNKVIKQALHYEEKNWDKFCEDMLSLVKIQYQELENLLTSKFLSQDGTGCQKNKVNSISLCFTSPYYQQVKS